MAEHDELCPVNTMAPGEGGCYCHLIARVRADERERIANDGLSWVVARERERLRAQVEALGSPLDEWDAAEKLNAVLALLDGTR